MANNSLADFQTPASVKITSILLFLLSLLAFIFSAWSFSFSGFSPGLQLNEALLVFSPLIGGLAGILSSIYLWKGRKWARVLSLALVIAWILFWFVALLKGVSRGTSLFALFSGLLSGLFIIYTFISQKPREFFNRQLIG